jgi:hypothetical protein
MRYLFILVTILISCSSTEKKKQDRNEEQTHHRSSLSIQADTSHFTTNFLNGLKDLFMNDQMGKGTVYDQYLVLNNTDTIYFASEFDEGTKYHFANLGANEQYHLEITRLNRVLLQYDALIFNGADTAYHSKGYAELNPAFFLGSEVMENDETGLSLLATEYIDFKQEVSINVGSEGKDDSIKAAFNVNKENSKYNGSPVLRLMK